MIREFVDRWNLRQDEVRAKFAARMPDDYEDLFRSVVVALRAEGDDKGPDPERIQPIDWGEYQGTLVFVVGAQGYEPAEFWACCIDYGSCTGCDTLEAIRGYDKGPPSEQQLADLMTLGLHIVQRLKPIHCGAES